MAANLSEAERQVLIALIEQTDPFETANNTHYAFYPKTLEEAAAYFLSFREDWRDAYASLHSRGYLESRADVYGLTADGMALARQERLDHPPIWYWYRKYYTMVQNSRAYSRFCAELYGRDLSQTDFSDMAQIELLIQIAGLNPGDRVLDLGCGNGLFAEYLSDRTGARVWGVDYIPEAIAQANQRTAGKSNRLHFQVGNFDHLDYPPESFDLLISIDTLYMPNDLPGTLRVLNNMLAPGGRMLIFYITILFDPALPRDSLLADNTDLARALQSINLPYRTWDVSEATFHLMRHKHQLARAMRAEFETEGTMFLYNHLIEESDSGAGTYDPHTANLSRYLYLVSKSDPA